MKKSSELKDLKWREKSYHIGVQGDSSFYGDHCRNCFNVCSSGSLSN